MTKLTITEKGQIILQKKLLRHLGVKPGQQVEICKLPNGKIELKAAAPGGNIDDFIGLLVDKTNKVATIEELTEVASKAWAGQVESIPH